MALHCDARQIRFHGSHLHLPKMIPNAMLQLSVVMPLIEIALTIDAMQTTMQKLASFNSSQQTSFFWPLERAKDLTVRITIHSRSLNSIINNSTSLMGDANRLGQILFEMLHNAVKHTSKGGITIAVRRLSMKSSRRVRLRFEVKDTGVGMNLEQQSKCFQNPSTTSTTKELMDKKNDGNNATGVGLGRCKLLIDAMGGTMGVQGKPEQGKP